MRKLGGSRHGHKFLRRWEGERRLFLCHKLITVKEMANKNNLLGMRSEEYRPDLIERAQRTCEGMA